MSQPTRARENSCARMPVFGSRPIRPYFRSPHRRFPRVESANLVRSSMIANQNADATAVGWQPLCHRAADVRGRAHYQNRVTANVP
jgi:hypothetical protein